MGGGYDATSDNEIPLDSISQPDPPLRLSAALFRGVFLAAVGHVVNTLLYSESVSAGHPDPVAALFPVAIMAFASGTFGATLAHVAAAACGSAVCTQLFMMMAAALQFPGHLKSKALDDPLSFWTVFLFFNFLSFLVLGVLGHYLHRASLWLFRDRYKPRS